MKKLLFIIVIICLLTICFFQYKNWSKFAAPNDYDYQISDQIDIAYFDQELVKNYFNNAQEIGTYARSVWHSDKVDVLSYNQENLFIKNKVAYYNLLVSQTKMYEKLLEKSASLKKEGYNNQQIQEIISNGTSPKDILVEKTINNLINIQFGDISQEVFQLQKKLSEKGYITPHDGNFRTSTQEMITKFQNENDLAPTGNVDYRTLKKLFQ